METFNLDNFMNLIDEMPELITVLKPAYIEHLADEFTATDVDIKTDLGIRNNNTFLAFYFIDHKENTEVDLAEVFGDSKVNAFIDHLLEK